MDRLFQEARVKPNFAPVPTPDKIEKAFTKLGRKRVHAAIEVEPSEEQLSYAKKLTEENSAERVIAALLSLIDMKPPTSAREVSGSFAGEYGNHRQAGPREGGFKPREGFKPRDGFKPREGGFKPQGPRFGGPQNSQGDGPAPHDAGPRRDEGAVRSEPRSYGADNGRGARPYDDRRGPPRAAGPQSYGGGAPAGSGPGPHGAPNKFKGPRPAWKPGKSPHKAGAPRDEGHAPRAEGGFKPRPFKKAPRPGGPRGG